MSVGPLISCNLLYLWLLFRKHPLLSFYGFQQFVNVSVEYNKVIKEALITSNWSKQKLHFESVKIKQAF